MVMTIEIVTKFAYKSEMYYEFIGSEYLAYGILRLPSDT